MDEHLTQPEDAPASRRSGRIAPHVLSLAVVWCPDDPQRVGEVLLVPSGGPRVFGRGGAQPDDPHPRLSLVRQRPGDNRLSEPLALPKISRVQLAIRSNGERLTVERLGLCTLLADGVETERLEVGPGDLVQLGNQLLFVCVRRPAWIAEVAEGRSLHAFGSPDRDGIVGESPAAWHLRADVDFVAHRAEHVFVAGPSGSGKELVAHAIHARSSRAKRPWIARNAATIPEGIADAELFGNTRNYPNAGMPERPGLIGEADGGTLFLDEFGELPTALQAHLLRVLDDGEYQRLGDARPRRSDLRLLAATNRGRESIKHDVLARFSLQIEVPGLERRLEDIPLIAGSILRRIVAADPAMATRAFPKGDPTAAPLLSRRLVRRLLRHDFTTHVRELEAMLWEALRRGGSELDLPESESRVPVARNALVNQATVPPGPSEGDDRSPEHLQRVLDENNGSIELAWRALGLSSRHTLARLIKRHDLVLRRKRL